MHLLYTTDQGEVALQYVINPPDGDYAILSHRWGDDEVLFHDLKLPGWQKKAGYRKIKYCMDQAAHDGLHYSWVDTCCINKESSAELSEAINSMYKWYEDAAICYAYLEDVREPEDFGRSTWFERGWTLQELIAPFHVVFYDHIWRKLGTRQNRSRELTTITNVPEAVLLQKSGLPVSSIAERLSWAAKRKTTRLEDEAYCLLGLLDVNMPLLYGEGKKAFWRLQEEIIRSSTDQTIFCWRASFERASTLLATSPQCFRGSTGLLDLLDENSFTMTNAGLQIRLPLTDLPTKEGGLCLAELSCSQRGKRQALVLRTTKDTRGGATVLVVDGGWRFVAWPDEHSNVNSAIHSITIGKTAATKAVTYSMDLFLSDNLSISHCWPRNLSFDKRRSCWSGGFSSSQLAAFGFALCYKAIENTALYQRFTVAVATSVSNGLPDTAETRILQYDIEDLATACTNAMDGAVHDYVRAKLWQQQSKNAQRVYHTSHPFGDQELVVSVHFLASSYAQVSVRVYCFYGARRKGNDTANQAFAMRLIDSLGSSDPSSIRRFRMLFDPQDSEPDSD